MKRLSSKELLAELQRRSGYQKRDEIEKAINKIEDADWRKGAKAAYDITLKRMGERLPTEYQDLMFYSLLDLIFEDIRSVLNKLEKEDGTEVELPEIPTFGTVGMGSFSAQISCSIPGDYLIVFAEGLFGFANLFAKVIGDSFILERTEKGYSFNVDFEKVKERMKQKDEIQRHFDDLILSYMIEGNPHAAKQYFPSKELDIIASVIREGMEVFVASHEYSHLVLGHLSAESRGFKGINADGRSEDAAKEAVDEERIKEVIYQWKDEVEADVLAMDITMAVMRKKGYDQALSFIGIGAAMLGIELLERMENLKEGKDPNQPRISATHPVAGIRKKILYEKMAESEPQALGLMDNVEKIVEYLWDNYVNFYRRK